MMDNIIKFAIDAHSSTNHLYDGKPYETHLQMVADVAQSFIEIVQPSERDNVLKSCWLHDTIEDCRLTYNDIKNVAGYNVAEIVYALTNEKGKTRKDRANSNYYKGIRNVPYADFVKICDRIANMRYSKQTGSTMFEVYKKELPEFIAFTMPTTRYLKMEIEFNNLIK